MKLRTDARNQGPSAGSGRAYYEVEERDNAGLCEARRLQESKVVSSNPDVYVRNELAENAWLWRRLIAVALRTAVQQFCWYLEGVQSRLVCREWPCVFWR